MSPAKAKLFFIFSLVVMFAVSATVVYSNYQTESFSGEEFEREVVQNKDITERAEDKYQKLSGMGNTRGLKQATLDVNPATGLRFYQKPRTTPRGFDLTADILGFVLLCFMVLLIASCSC
eukprot:TRINITY_DN7850_c0_g1_i1.p1 TRINITY_DN7850_c0_g1~~TRINITY_DN7850_c0_g1_i1.p1  ORF type:complete len:120 (-),score=28.73 TRINITY_DN7850_c0_g1_i1:111-470(-)